MKWRTYHGKKRGEKRIVLDMTTPEAATLLAVAGMCGTPDYTVEVRSRKARRVLERITRNLHDAFNRIGR